MLPQGRLHERAQCAGCLEVPSSCSLVAISRGIPRELPDFSLFTPSRPQKGKIEACLPKSYPPGPAGPRFACLPRYRKFPAETQRTYHLLIFSANAFHVGFQGITFIF